MDFNLTEEQQAIYDMAREFGEEKIAPFASQWEHEGTIPRSLLEEIGALGFGGMCVCDEYGGSDLSRLDATLVIEALSHSCPSVASFISIHNMCAKMIDNSGSKELKAKWLPQFCSMEKVASYCLTEPGSGSDAGALRTKATLTSEGYVLNGTKAFISGGNYSDVYVVMCRTGADGPQGISTLLVEKGTLGLSFGAFEEKMGWKAQPTTQVQFDDCTVSVDNLLGKEGAGFKYAMAGLDGGV